MSAPDTGQRKRISNAVWPVGAVTLDAEVNQRLRAWGLALLTRRWT